MGKSAGSEMPIAPEASGKYEHYLRLFTSKVPGPDYYL